MILPETVKIMSRKPKLLLVEDTPYLRYAFGRLLRFKGFEVVEAGDGQEALDSIESNMPELIVTDLMMPVMDGIELIRKLRADPRTSKIPVLAISADASDRAERNAREAGAADFVTKPIELIPLVERILALGGQESAEG